MYESPVRLSPFASGEPARRRSWPHGAAALAEVQRLIETTQLSHRAIHGWTGVPRATISRHVLEQGWLRPWAGLEEPPQSPEAKRRWQRGELAARLLRAAERRVDDVALNPTASPGAFAQAAKLLTLIQRLDRPGQPRRPVPRVKRLKAARGERAMTERSAAEHV